MSLLECIFILFLGQANREQDGPVNLERAKKDARVSMYVYLEWTAEIHVADLLRGQLQS